MHPVKLMKSWSTPRFFLLNAFSLKVKCASSFSTSYSMFVEVSPFKVASWNSSSAVLIRIVFSENFE